MLYLLKIHIYLYIFVTLRLLVFHFSTSLQNKEMITKTNNLREPLGSQKSRFFSLSQTKAAGSLKRTRIPSFLDAHPHALHRPPRNPCTHPQGHMGPGSADSARMCGSLVLGGTKDAREWKWNKLFTVSVSSAESSIFFLFTLSYIPNGGLDFGFQLEAGS